MSISRRAYRWFYDNVHSRYYDLLLKWAFWPLGGETAVRQKLTDVAAFSPGIRLLDLCCGTGSATFVAADQLGPSAFVVGGDLSEGQVRRARARNRFPNVHFIVTDAATTAFPDNYFNHVVIPHALHEMTYEARLAALRESRRVLINGGRLTVFEIDRPPLAIWRLVLAFFWFYWLPFNFETPTRRDLLRRGLVNEISEAGFVEARKISLSAGALQVVSAEKRNPANDL